MKKLLKSKLIFVFVVVVMVFGIAAGVVGFSRSARANTIITVQGAVSCSYHQLVGVWVRSSLLTGGDSHFASWSTQYRPNYDGTFTTTISVSSLPTLVQLHIGCGYLNSTGAWWSDNWTPWTAIYSSVTLEASCNEGTVQPANGPNTRCAFSPTRAETAAINWAASYIGKKAYINLCLTFVFDAYSAAGIDLRKFVNYNITKFTYPQDIWPYINTSEIKGTGTPPAGALVFFNATSPHDHTYSHVELSVGGGYMISTSDTFMKDQVHYETLDQHAASGAWNKYVGWWLPA